MKNFQYEAYQVASTTPSPYNKGDTSMQNVMTRIQTKAMKSTKLSQAKCLISPKTQPRGPNELLEGINQNKKKLRLWGMQHEVLKIKRDWELIKTSPNWLLLNPPRQCKWGHRITLIVTTLNTVSWRLCTNLLTSILVDLSWYYTKEILRTLTRTKLSVSMHSSKFNLQLLIRCKDHPSYSARSNNLAWYEFPQALAFRNDAPREFKFNSNSNDIWMETHL